MPFFMRIVIDNAQQIRDPTNIAPEVVANARLGCSIMLCYDDKSFVRATLPSLDQNARYFEKRLIIGA